MRVPSLSVLPAPVAAGSRWGAFWIAMLLLAALAGYANGWGRLDKVLMDQIGSLHGDDPPDDILIVAIDDASIDALGRWPWRRSTHAQLIDRLAGQGARAIALDLLLSEADMAYPDDATALAQALRAAGTVVLPMNLAGADGLQPVLPLPSLLSATRAVGHGHLDVDDDGVVRSTRLYDGPGERRWPHWVLALLAVGGEATPDAAEDTPVPTLIPFAGAPGHFPRVSYIDVLEGRVEPERLRGSYVLVGATAAGVGIAYPTPFTGEQRLMPGIEIAANLLHGLRGGETLRLATPWENALFCAFPLLLAAFLLVRWPPRWAFWSLIGLMALTLLAAWVLRRSPGVQVAPLAALASLALAYPLWAWVRLDAVVKYLAREFQALQRQDRLFVAPNAARLPSGDTLDRQMQAMAGAVEELRTLQRFVHDSLDSLGDAVIVVDERGTVLLANGMAARCFDQPAHALLDRSLPDLLQARFVLENHAPLPDLGAAMQGEPATWAVRDAQGRDHLLKCVPRRSADGQALGSIVSLVDITAVQRVQKQREEALRFLSHDMRAPQSAILTLLDLHRIDPGAEPELFERIGAHARRTLALSDDFVHLARAQSSTHEPVLMDLGDALIEAADRYWDQARAHAVTIETELPPEPAWCLADRELMTRAVGNLIDNALKHGPRQARIGCRLVREGQTHVLSVRDEGPGIAAEDQADLFDEFKRLDGAAGTRGAGLGLAFVQTVVQRHQGRVRVISAPGQGAEFRLELPAATAPEDAVLPTG